MEFRGYSTPSLHITDIDSLHVKPVDRDIVLESEIIPRSKQVVQLDVKIEEGRDLKSILLFNDNDFLFEVPLAQDAKGK